MLPARAAAYPEKGRARVPSGKQWKEDGMIGVLLLLILLILVFGGLGIFVAKVFLLGLAIAVLLSLLTGRAWYRSI